MMLVELLLIDLALVVLLDVAVVRPFARRWRRVRGERRLGLLPTALARGCGASTDKHGECE